MYINFDERKQEKGAEPRKKPLQYCCGKSEVNNHIVLDDVTTKQSTTRKRPCSSTAVGFFCSHVSMDILL